MPRRRQPPSQATSSLKEPPRWRYRHARNKSRFSGKVVTVLVGEWRVPFHIHQGLLSTSAYFSGIINGIWKESQGVIPIEDAHPDIFEVYITWVYTREIVVSEELETNDKYTFLHHTYVFADYLQDQDFRDAILNSILSLAKQTRSYPHHLAELLYQQTVVSSPWRQLYIDLWLCSIDEGDGIINQDWIDVNEGPKEFFIDLLARQSSALFEKEEVEGGLEYVEKRRGSGRPRRVQPPTLSYRGWRM